MKLRPLRPEDCDRLLAWIDSADALWQWSGARAFTWPLDRGQLRRDLAAHDGSMHVFAGIDDSGEMVGHVLLDAQPNHGLGNIGRVAVAPERRGSGLGTALMRAIVRYGFDELGLHRLQLNVYTFNTAAIATYRSVGFVAEGVARESTLGSAGYWDGLTMSLLEDEYRRPASLGEDVRLAGPRDADGVAGLLTRLGCPHDRETAAQGLLEWATDPNGVVLVAEADGSVAGVAAVQQQRHIGRAGAHAKAVILAAAAREGDDDDASDSAIGRRLHTAAERWAAQRGLTHVEISPLSAPET